MEEIGIRFVGGKQGRDVQSHALIKSMDVAASTTYQERWGLLQMSLAIRELEPYCQ